MQANSQPPSPPLSADDLRQVLEADFGAGLLFWKPRGRDMFSSNRSAATWNARFASRPALNSVHPDGYLNGSIFGRLYLAHRVLFAMRHGTWPEYIDHINGDRSDNRIENLRSVTRSENGCNAKTPITNTSGQIGVSWSERDQRWTAYITLNKKRKALGNFVLIEDAIECRKQGEILYGFHQNHGRMS